MEDVLIGLSYIFLGVLLFKFFGKKVNLITSVFFVLAYYLPGIVAIWLSLTESKSLEGLEMVGQGVFLLLSLFISLVLVTLGNIVLLIDLILKKRSNSPPVGTLDTENN